MPTQAGVSYPKYYAWVKIYDEQKKLIDQGAVRVAAEDKTKFEITNFVNLKKIREDSDDLAHTFPAALCPKIVEKAMSIPH